MLILPRNIQALACCAGACLQSFLHLGRIQPAEWGIVNRRKLGNFQPALTIPARRLPTLRSARSSRHPPRALPHWLAPASMPPPAHRADRSGRIKRKTGTSVPAWPFDSASVSAKKSLSGRPSPLACFFSALICSHCSVVGISSKRLSFPLTAALLPVRPLRSTGLTPLLHCGELLQFTS